MSRDPYLGQGLISGRTGPGQSWEACWGSTSQELLEATQDRGSEPTASAENVPTEQKGHLQVTLSTGEEPGGSHLFKNLQESYWA